MTPSTGKPQGLIVRSRGLLLSLMVAALVLVVIVPLPPMVMDVLLAANIALAAVILLTVIHIPTPLDFNVFPSILLGATLLRLVLNVATTRLILTGGAGGRTVEQARLAAGHVIWSFSGFVTHGSLAVGVILFLILLVIQFVVITRGAARISEVAARFMLDAMPGKQMAIDADFGAGLISEDQARQRRARIAKEADFYGAMDGASKFVRGDAVAALIITLINILGGLFVGLVEYGWSWSQTTALFTRLTIGDGLVTQVPAFIISIAAALMVSRTTVRTNLGDEVVRQLTSRPIALGITAAFLGVLMLTSLPTLPLLLLAGGLGGMAMLLRDRGETADEDYLADLDEDDDDDVQAPPRTVPSASRRREPAKPAAVLPAGSALPAVDPVSVEVGFALVRMVDPARGGDLLDRIAALREELAREMGVCVPPVRIRDNLHLEAHEYVIRLREARAAGGKLYAGRLLAVPRGEQTEPFEGVETAEPAFGTAAYWIGPEQRHQAQARGYTVVEPVGVLVTHLAETLRHHAADLLSRQQVVGMLEQLSGEHGALVTEVTQRVGAGKVRRVLQNLLREGVSVRDLEIILEAVCDAAGSSADPEQLTEGVRGHLARSLSRQFCGPDGSLRCVRLAEGTERYLDEQLSREPVSPALALGAKTAQRVCQAVAKALDRLRQEGSRPVVVCRRTLRRHLRDLLASQEPDAIVLGYDEIDSVPVEAVATVELGEA